LRAEGFFCSLDVLSGGLAIGKLQLLSQKKKNFLSCKFFQFSIYGYQNPGSGLVVSLKRVRKTASSGQILLKTILHSGGF
jgi:hypothetical protein